MLSRRHLTFGAAAATLAASAGYARANVRQEPERWARTLIDAAHAQVGVTVTYNPAYVVLDFPGGDVPRDRGVCTDVIVRAYRDAFGVDLQALVNADMRRAFSAYPGTWGLSRPDPNIDHRRVPNLETWLTRQGYAIEPGDAPANFRPGDIVSQRLPGGQAHIGIVSDRRNVDGSRLLLIHNIGAGARVEDVLMAFTVAGHFRFKPPTG